MVFTIFKYFFSFKKNPSFQNMQISKVTQQILMKYDEEIYLSQFVS